MAVTFDESKMYEEEADNRVSAHVSVENQDLTASEMTSFLGMEPDEQHSRGDRRKHASDRTPEHLQRYDSSLWSVSSTLPRTAFFEDHLDDLWNRVAALLERVPEMPGKSETTLILWRDLDGRASQGHGFWLSALWIGLLGRIGGELSLDQYVLRDGPGED